MTSMIYGAYGQPVALDLDDTVRFKVPAVAEATVRITPAPRRPNVDPARFEERIRIPRTISVVDEPWQTTELPALVEYSLRPRKPDYVGRHHQPGLFARLLRWIGGRR
jgi:hypothetical protein